MALNANWHTMVNYFAWRRIAWNKSMCDLCRTVREWYHNHKTEWAVSASFWIGLIGVIAFTASIRPRSDSTQQNDDEVKCNTYILSAYYNTKLIEYARDLCCAQLPFLTAFKKQKGRFCGGLPRHIWMGHCDAIKMAPRVQSSSWLVPRRKIIRPDWLRSIKPNYTSTHQTQTRLIYITDTVFPT